jgi:hypothetical protein
MNIAPNRAVAILTPLIFAPLAGAVSVLIARYVPGVDIDSSSLEAIFIAGATIAFAKAGIWLKGWQDHEKREDGTAFAASLNAHDEPELGTATDDLDPVDETEIDGDHLFEADDAELDDDMAEPLTAGTAG